MLVERLTTTHPDVLRELLATFIHTLIGAEADAVCGAGMASAERTHQSAQRLSVQKVMGSDGLDSRGRPSVAATLGGDESGATGWRFSGLEGLVGVAHGLNRSSATRRDERGRCRETDRDPRRSAEEQPHRRLPSRP